MKIRVETFDFKRKGMKLRKLLLILKRKTGPLKQLSATRSCFLVSNKDPGADL